jgi:excisionase family DNA binding protein
MLYDEKNTFVSLNTAANYFNLPNSYLKNLADTGAIPFLVVNGRCRFNLTAVEAALVKLAARKELRSIPQNEKRNDKNLWRVQ